MEPNDDDDDGSMRVTARREQSRRETGAMRARLAQSNRGYINPRGNKPLLLWDALLSLIALYIGFFTLVEVAVPDPYTLPSFGRNFFAGVLFTALISIDMVLSFRRAFLSLIHI